MYKSASSFGQLILNCSTLALMMYDAVMYAIKQIAIKPEQFWLWTGFQRVTLSSQLTAPITGGFVSSVGRASRGNMKVMGSDPVQILQA